jgi:hypothetical protein
MEHAMDDDSAASKRTASKKTTRKLINIPKTVPSEHPTTLTPPTVIPSDDGFELPKTEPAPPDMDDALPLPPPGLKGFDPYNQVGISPQRRGKQMVWIVALCLVLVVGSLSGLYLYRQTFVPPVSHPALSAHNNGTKTAARPRTRRVIQAIQHAALPMYHLNYATTSVQSWINRQSVGPPWTFAHIPSLIR